PFILTYSRARLCSVPFRDSANLLRNSQRYGSGGSGRFNSRTCCHHSFTATGTGFRTTWACEQPHIGSMLMKVTINRTASPFPPGVAGCRPRKGYGRPAPPPGPEGWLGRSLRRPGPPDGAKTGASKTPPQPPEALPLREEGSTGPPLPLRERGQG